MVKILWVDDEVELLKPHVLFLKQRSIRRIDGHDQYADADFSR